MKNEMNHIWRQLAAVILGLLGFSSCERIGWGVCMYGEPHADFKALGTVSDENGKPIEGIRVAIQQHRHYENTSGVIYDQNDWYENDTLYTDDKGAYQLIRSVFESPNDVKIVFEDIDGEENGGEYTSAEATPEVKRTKKGDICILLSLTALSLSWSRFTRVLIRNTVKNNCPARVGERF